MTAQRDLLDVLRSTLEDVEQEWRRLRAPVVDLLRPGLSDEEMEARAAAGGWQLPLELRVWWSWHDGAAPHGDRSIGPGSFDLLSLQEALDATALQRRENPEGAGPHLPVWDRHWLLFLQQGPQRLYADCAHRPYGSPRASRIGMVPYEWEDADLTRAGSLLELADLWLWSLRQDLFALDAHGQLSPVDRAGWPLWLRLSLI